MQPGQGWTDHCPGLCPCWTRGGRDGGSPPAPSPVMQEETLARKGRGRMRVERRERGGGSSDLEIGRELLGVAVAHGTERQLVDVLGLPHRRYAREKVSTVDQRLLPCWDVPARRKVEMRTDQQDSKVTCTFLGKVFCASSRTDTLKHRYRNLRAPGNRSIALQTEPPRSRLD